MEFTFSVNEILEIVGEGVLSGATEAAVTGIASLAEARPGDLSFLGNLKYRSAVPDSRASVILLPRDYTETVPDGHDQVYIRVPYPSLALAEICVRIEMHLWPKPAPGVHQSAIVSACADVDPTAHIGPFCVIAEQATVGAGCILEGYDVVGRLVSIGRDCWIKPRVSLGEDSQIGDRVRLHPGVVVGSDGYGYECVERAHRKLPQIGRVVIEDDVEIGANTTIDRARFDVTTIGRGTKIDNLVHIGHNVTIGRHCLIIAQAGISGSTTLEDHVILGGQAGVVGHVTLGENSQIGAQAGVINSLEPRSKVWGTPAYAMMQVQRIEILQRRLPDLFKRVASLEEMLNVHP